MEKRTRYSSEEKTKILRDYIDNNLTISLVCEKYQIRPNIIYRWKKQMFESAPDALSNSKKKSEKQLSSAESRIAELEALLAKREALIAEIVEDNIALKKKLNGDISIKNGSNRK